VQVKPIDVIAQLYILMYFVIVLCMYVFPMFHQELTLILREIVHRVRHPGWQQKKLSIYVQVL
jgi:hypothetical protein